MSPQQLSLPFSPVRNSNLFSNHWLEHRLPLEPEWSEMRKAAQAALENLLTLWSKEKPRVEQYKEAQLERAFIDKVFETLGWPFIPQPELRGRTPDYALFADEIRKDAAIQTARSTDAWWQHALVVADAKAWHVLLDRPLTVKHKREYPPEQIAWYCTNSFCSFGILTNGQSWRLVPREHAPGQPRYLTYLECDLARILDACATSLAVGDAFEDFLRFYLFFAPAAFVDSAGRKSLIERARQGSSEYRVGVGRDLKERVFEALRLATEGFLQHGPNGLNHQRDLELCREQSMTLLYRLLFVLFAEDRQLLPYRLDKTYTDNRSLGRLRDDIATKLDRISAGRDLEYGAGDRSLWDDLQSLFDLIDAGGARYKVPAYNGGLFDPDQHPFLKDKCLSDPYLARVIDQLSRAADPLHPDAGPCRVDYRDLAIQHLGNVYEGLLELKPHYATEPMVVIRERGNTGNETIIPVAASTPQGFERTTQRYARDDWLVLYPRTYRQLHRRKGAIAHM